MPPILTEDEVKQARKLRLRIIKLEKELSTLKVKQMVLAAQVLNRELDEGKLK